MKRSSYCIKILFNETNYYLGQRYLDNNKLNGKIPEKLFNLPKLKKLLVVLLFSIQILFYEVNYYLDQRRLDYNELNGEIPKEVSNLSNLQEL